jgi:restriction system protein
LARRRGFFAELQHQAQVAARQAEQQQRAMVAAARRAEAAQRADQRAAAAYARASEADRKRLQREAAAAHAEAMQAEVDQLNEELAAKYEDLDNLLAATLGVDDFVDLEALKQSVNHPPFDRSDLEEKTPLAPQIPRPVEPARWAPDPVKGIFNKQKRLLEAQEKAETDFVAAWQAWWHEDQAYPAKVAKAKEDYDASERARIAALEVERARYINECAAREKDVAAHNATVDEFIANLGYGAVQAVNEYVGIVLANSVYPDEFQVEHEAEFDPSTAELLARVIIPGPQEVPSIKTYKYTKATDQITPTELAIRDAKARYANVVHQVALRTVHEVFEADRRKLIKAISLEVGVETNDPATGKVMFIPFVSAAVARDRFEEIDLSGVVPVATLEHLGAAVSKAPYSLTPVSGAGIRRTQ